jgi:Trk K+ transport system NAD-binding subunit
MLSSVGWDMDLSVIWYEDKEREDMYPAHGLLLNIGTRILVLASLETLQKLEKLNGKTERN